MGYSKRQYFEELEDSRRYIKSEKFVCSKCINDEYVAEYVKENGHNEKCDFCGKRKKCIPLNALLEMVYLYLHDDYALADEAFMYVSSEGGWQGPTIDCYDILNNDLSFMSSSLLSEIQNCFTVQDQAFCERSFVEFEDDSNILIPTWNEFEKVLQNKSRFTILMGNEHEYGELTPIGLCNIIGYYLQKLNTIKEISTSTIIYRARKKGNYKLDAKELGAPPSGKTPANRMSPTGISFFYGSFDKNTCLKEALGDSNELFVISEWELLRSVRLLDLSKCHRLSQHEISIFDHANTWKRHFFPFLNELISRLCKPVDRNLSSTQKEIEYLPTQVFSEYLKNFFKDNDGNRIDGVIYPSSKASGHNNFVLFYGQECNISSETYGTQILNLKRVFSPKIIYRKSAF